MESTFHNIDIEKKRYRQYAKRAHVYMTHLADVYAKRRYDADEAVCASIADTAQHKAIIKKLNPFLGVRHVVLIGIGGSSLGTEAVFNALKTPTAPTLTVLDIIDDEAYHTLETICDETASLSDMVLVVVSKSGTTMETSVNASMALTLFESRFGARYAEQVIVVADAESELYRNAKKKKILTFTIPTKVGGRYSVFTTAGLVPLTLLGVDTSALLRGARSVFTDVSHLSQTVDRALYLACMAEQGMHTVNFFAFSKRLTGIGLWYRQLLAESIGKSHTKKKKPFLHALLPTVTSVADLHSVAQLYLSGYKGVYTYFFNVANYSEFMISAHDIVPLPTLVIGRQTNEITSALHSGVVKAYDDAHLPYSELVIPEVSPEHVGMLLTMLMVEVIVFAHLFGVDAFNQPHVESYKRYMREALAT